MKIQKIAKFSERLVRTFPASIVLAVFANCLLLEVVKADTRDCTPTVDQIALFRDEGFRGPCVVKDIGEHKQVHLPRNTSLDVNEDLRGVAAPSFSSIKVGANVETLACQERYLHGVCALVYQDTRSLADRESSRGREISSAASFFVRHKNQPPACRPDDDQVGVWMYQYFFGPCEVIDIGAYSGLRSARSIRVGSQVQAQLCDDLRFRGNCMVLTPGYFSHWAYPHTSNTGVLSIKVGRRSESSSCTPGANEVALFEYGHFVGRCRVFGIGDYSVSETEGWADDPITSVKVGNNVLFALCNDSGNGTRRDCHRPLRYDIPDMFEVARYAPHLSHLLSVWERGESPVWAGRSSSEEQPPPPVAIDYRLRLSANPFFEGFETWSGRFPTQGRLNGNLTRITNPRTSVWVGFLKPGHGAADCGDPTAYVLLLPGQTLTADQLNTVFGSRTPALPVQFLVCSGAIGERTAGGGLRFPSLPLDISYTRR